MLFLKCLLRGPSHSWSSPALSCNHGIFDTAVSLSHFSAHTHEFSLRPCSLPGPVLVAKVHGDTAERRTSCTFSLEANKTTPCLPSGVAECVFINGRDRGWRLVSFFMGPGSLPCHHQSQWLSPGNPVVLWGCPLEDSHLSSLLPILPVNTSV